MFRVLRAPKSQIALRQRSLNEQQQQQRQAQKPKAATPSLPPQPLPTGQELRSDEIPDAGMADMLSSMIESYMKVSDIKEPTRKRRHHTQPAQPAPEPAANDTDDEDNMDIDEYVYDVYYRDIEALPQASSTGLVGLM